MEEEEKKEKAMFNPFGATGASNVQKKVFLGLFLALINVINVQHLITQPT